jgi:hypothetical protein
MVDGIDRSLVEDDTGTGAIAFSVHSPSEPTRKMRQKYHVWLTTTASYRLSKEP